MTRDRPRMVFLRPPNSLDTFTLNEDPARAGTAGSIDHFGLRMVDRAKLGDAIEEVERAGGRLIGASKWPGPHRSAPHPNTGTTPTPDWTRRTPLGIRQRRAATARSR